MRASDACVKIWILFIAAQTNTFDASRKYAIMVIPLEVKNKSVKFLRSSLIISNGGA